jgi:choline dehydrogenase
VRGLTADAIGHDGYTPTGIAVTIRAKYVIAAGGAINTPALLLRRACPIRTNKPDAGHLFIR